MFNKYLNKEIILENIITDINLVNIEDNIEYLSRNDGILIKGNINVDCEYLSYGVIKHFKDNIEVSIFVPIENIINNELMFKVKDFDYIFKDNKLSLSFKIDIEGYKEIEKSFQDENKEMEIVSNVDVDLEDIEQYLKVDDDVILLENENEITQFVDTKEPKKSKDESENINIENLEINDEGKRLMFNIQGEEEAIKYIDTKEKVESKKSFFDTLFKKDKKVKLVKYRVILEDDTYENISEEYNVNLYKLKELNNNMSLELGKIIKIPNATEWGNIR